MSKKIEFEIQDTRTASSPTEPVSSQKDLGVCDFCNHRPAIETVVRNRPSEDGEFIEVKMKYCGRC